MGASNFEGQKNEREREKKKKRSIIGHIMNLGSRRNTDIPRAGPQ